MKSLYINAASGISGDMTVAALLDLGASESKLKGVLASLPDQRFNIRISRVQKAAIDACDFAVELSEDNHDHDMGYLFSHRHGLFAGGHGHSGCGHDHPHEHDEDSQHPHEHCQNHSHDHEHRHSCACMHHHDHHVHAHHDSSHHGHVHSHDHRNLEDVLGIIFATNASQNAKTIAQNIFTILAEAESKAHNKPIKDVHFHEVGALDSIIDILSVAVLIDDLGIDEVIVSPLSEGFGHIRCQHGLLPIPVPAVANIVERYGLTLKSCPIEAELVTPTGAAIAAALKTQDALPDCYRILKTGLGAGKRSYDIPSLLRIMIIEKVTSEERTDTIVKLESNIDDTTPEVLGFVLEELLKAGALDASFSPLFMKKNRPAYELQVICREAQREALEHIIFTETTTIGIRRTTMERTMLSREIQSISTPLGSVNVKVCTIPAFKDKAKVVKYYPEFESVKALALTSGHSFNDVYQMTLRACHEA